MLQNQRNDIKRDIYWFLWVLQRFLDEGKTDTIEVVVDKCQEGEIYNYISQAFDIAALNIPHKINAETINFLYSNVGFCKDEIERKYNVYDNGLVSLSVIAIEWIYSGFDHLYK